MDPEDQVLEDLEVTSTGVTGLEIAITDQEDADERLLGLKEYLNKRDGDDSKVEHLTVQFSTECEESGWGGNSPILAPLVGLIRQCASSLLTLNLRGIPFDELFDVRTSNTARGDPEVFQPLLGALCACTELRGLYVSRKEGDGCHMRHSRLVLRLAECLPNLRTLQWRCLKPNGAERPTPFSAAFLSAMATAPEPGLRLLQADNCDFCACETPAEDVFPASLRVLALYNHEVYFKGKLEHLLRECSALEELYLCNFNMESTKAARFHKMRRAMMNLHVLVLDICNFSCDYREWVREMKDPTAQLPKLETLIIQNLNCIMPSFSFARCPRLANLAVGFLHPEHLPWLRSFLASSGGRLKTLQLQLALCPDEVEEADEWNSEHEDEDGDEDVSDVDEYEDRYEECFQGVPDHIRAVLIGITRSRSRPPSRKRPPRYEGVFKALGGAKRLEHLQLVLRDIPAEIAASVTNVESSSCAILPRLASVGIFVDYNEGQNCDIHYGPASRKGTAKHYCKEFGRLQQAGCLPALRKAYFHPVQRAYISFRGEIKAMTGTEGFKAVVLEDPGHAMGKAWLRGSPGAQSSEGLSRAIASMNFERGLCKLNSPVHHPLRGVKRLGYLYEEPLEESVSDDEGFGQNADLDDGQLTAPGWQTLYSDCVSDGWSTDNEDYEDDVSGDEPDVTEAPED